MYLFLMLTITLLTSPIQADVYTVYAHGIVDKPSQIVRFQQAIMTDTEHTKAVIFPDTCKETGWGINRLICEITSLTRKTINRSKMYMAETQDIQASQQTLSTIPSDEDIILYGCSRGGSTLINLLAQDNPEQIKALILDAAPAYMPSTIHPIMAQLGIPAQYDAAIFRTLFPAYPKNATGPLSRIKNIKNKNLPILIIHSQNDAKVPYLHALQLYQELQNQEFKHVYLLTIPAGKHAFLLQDPQIKDLYLEVIHSFYKKYNLPYDPTWAHDNLSKYQPMLDEVQEQITELEDALQKQFQASVWRNIIVASAATALILSYWLYKKLTT